MRKAILTITGKGGGTKEFKLEKVGEKVVVTPMAGKAAQGN